MRERRQGVNVVGYHRQALGLGAEARRIVRILKAAGIAVATIDAPGSGSPTLSEFPESDNEWRYDATLSVVAGDQLLGVMQKLGLENFSHGPHTGMWYWELEQINDAMRSALSLVDRLVAGSHYVWRTLVQETYRPTLELPLTPPILGSASFSRDHFGLPDDRLVFLCTFDFFSVIERKNPLGAIRAFREAFREDEGPILVVKSQNSSFLPDDREIVRREIGSRSDVIWIDETFSDAEQLSLISCSDLLVSLHRAEGLGLHLLEALLQGVPVLATRYSAPWEFMEMSYALPVDYSLTSVQNGNGVYPAGSKWAAPDLFHAGAQMKRYASNDGLRSSMKNATRKVRRKLSNEEVAGSMLYEWVAS